MSTELYAEWLMNIRQVTIFATLPTPCNERTLIELSADHKSLNVIHNEQHSTLQLPCQAAAGASLKAPTIGLKELSFRVQAAEAPREGEKNGLREDVNCIWPASELQSSTQIACKACKSIVIREGIKVWKDLPNENWAEMMDIWHCHKPQDAEETHGMNGCTKGYAASNEQSPRPGVVFVDELHFKVTASDCIGVEGNKKEACLRLMLDLWHTCRYNCPRMIPTQCSTCSLILPSEPPCWKG